MSKLDKSAGMPSLANPDVLAHVLAGLTRTSSRTGSWESYSPMTRNNDSVAAALAVLPGKGDSPRVIRQFTSIFLVSRTDELWRVYDADAPDSIDREMPTPTSRRTCRVFVALATKEETRVFTFAERDSRDVEPLVLQAQLDKSATI